MNRRRPSTVHAALMISLILVVSIASSRLHADTGTCGGQMLTLPFTDVPSTNLFFCSIAGAYFSALTNGTTPTTYSPGSSVPREQMAAFVSRTLDQAVKRGSSRAALGQWWTNKTVKRLATSTNGHNPRFLACDGLTVWVSNTDGNTVSRIDIKTGNLISTLTGIPSPEQIVIVSGLVYVVSFRSPGIIYSAAIAVTSDGVMTPRYTNLGPNPGGLTFDGQNLWTANGGTGPGTGSISRVNVDTDETITFTTGFSQPGGILFDGASLWVTDGGDTSLKRVDTTTGAVLQTIALSGLIQSIVFDGTNLWIPCKVPDQVYVVRAVGGLTGAILAQLTGNGLNGPYQAAFDGERICVTNADTQGVSLWKASDLSPIISFNIPNIPFYNSRGVCSDGTTFFIGFRETRGFSGLIVPL